MPETAKKQNSPDPTTAGKARMLQDTFLEDLRSSKAEVSMFLVNGIKLHGIIDYFDQYVILLRNSVTQMVYKHAISTIVPGGGGPPSERRTEHERPSAARPPHGRFAPRRPG